MFPLRDNNPTRGRPLITLALIAVNLAVFFLGQPAAFWLPVSISVSMACGGSTASALARNFRAIASSSRR